MTARKSYVYFDDAEVTRTSKLYKVILEQEETTIYLKETLVETIATSTNQDENLIAILLAHMECVRRSRNTNINKDARKLDDKIVAEGLKILLRDILIEDLIQKMQSIKWHQIVEILTAESPIEELRNL